MNIETIDCTNVKLIRKTLDEKLTDFGLGLTATTGNASYSATEIRFKVIITTTKNPDAIKDLAKEQFKIHAELFELKPTDFGRTFTSNNETFTITGIAPNRKKYPLSAERANGKQYKFTEHAVKATLSRAEK